MSSRIPAVLYAASLSQALPICAAVARRGWHLPVPTRWVLLWCAALLFGDVVWQVVAHSRGENLWLQYLTVPLGSALALWALSWWQPTELLRLGYRVAIPFLLVATGAPLLLPRPVQWFDQIVAPLHAIVVLGGAVHTLVHRSLRADTPIVRDSWFWVSLGMSLYFGAKVALRPFAEALIASHPDWVRAAYIAKAWLDIFAFLLITIGILCPPFPRRSGGLS